MRLLLLTARPDLRTNSRLVEAADGLGAECVLIDAGTVSAQAADGGLELLGLEIGGAIGLPLFLSQAFAKARRASGAGGRIVHVSSVSSTHSMYGKAAYGTAKAGMDAMTRALALEWGAAGICVNAVSPSHVATEQIKELAASGALPVDQITARIPLGRLAEPDEIADAVVFLLSDRARFITGQVLGVDGGYSANGDFAAPPA